MNQGGEPGHDDYGLPRVDIQIPDDARELYRDVQAYHRELRAQRRHARSRRLRAPLHRTGIIVPLIAGCLILAMIVGMVLTMFSANPYFSGIAGPEPGSPTVRNGGSSASPGGATQTNSASSPASASPSASGPVSIGPSHAARLPGKTISVAGKPLELRSLTSTALAMVPASCGCSTAIGQLLSQAQSAGVTVYLIGPPGSLAELNDLAPTTARGTAMVAIDAGNILNSVYRPAGLTVLLVDSHGAVTVRSSLRAGFRMQARLRSLKPAG